MADRAQPTDQAQRDAAIDPSRSFIVQAPAGSGKTELLIQRYLRLLAQVDHPEEILAITFTRKAAGEMRQRLESALRAADAGVPPTAEKPHLAVSFDLASQVIDRDRALGWGIAQQPARLRIGTIDSVNAAIARRAPLSDGRTSSNELVDNIEPVFRDTVRDLLGEADGDSPHGQAIRAMLRHCDNRADKVETLLLAMLQKRDQWLPLVGHSDPLDRQELRTILDESLGDLVAAGMHAVAQAFPRTVADDVITAMNHASKYLTEKGSNSAIAGWGLRSDVPGKNPQDLSAWHALAEALLTQKNDWRKTLNVKQGFSTDKEDAAAKAHAIELLAGFADQHRFLESLGSVRKLPDPNYSDDQWAIIDALWTLLPVAVAILKENFVERGITDYTEIALEALATLGSNDDVSDIRLLLDYQIKHILLDEFQDTSRIQFELLANLTDGWETEADRSVFLVGDPMQSIYRFRAAEVRLFLDVRTKGIGSLSFEELVLTNNFRSEPAIVDWFNDAFSAIFPQQDDAEHGAITFARSRPFLPARQPRGDNTPAVSWHTLPFGDDDAEARRVASIVSDALQNDPDSSVGILVRGRNHAVAIARQLRDQGIAYIAGDLEKLHEQSVVQDLIALTRALTHIGDRLGWLAILRAPWCGLTLEDLHLLAAGDHESCIWTLLHDQAVLQRLTPSARQRIDRCLPILDASLERCGVLPLRDLVEGTWHQLGGIESLGENAADGLDRAEQYFNLLTTLGYTTDCPDGGELVKQVEEQSLSRPAAEGGVQIMTIHKAKGLEFDVVVLPGLAKKPRSSSKPPLLFHQFEPSAGLDRLVVAPIAAGDKDDDPVHDLLWSLEKTREEHERNRLLYVAVTRARSKLHFFAAVKLSRNKDDEIARPTSSSLLAGLWPVADQQVEWPFDLLPENVTSKPGERDIDFRSVTLRRLPGDWQPSPEPLPVGQRFMDTPRQSREEVEFDWATQATKHVGSITHRWLQQIAEDGLEQWDIERVSRLGPQIAIGLRRAGVGANQLDSSVQRVTDALARTLADERGRWILDAHEQAANEFCVTTQDPEQGQFRDNIIDRTFVCEQGIRWIIDYKTSSHEGGDLQAFLESEAERYRPQLTRYRDAMLSLGHGVDSEHHASEIRTALYFPLLQSWHVVECDASERAR